jgi:hypothetical protein
MSNEVAPGPLDGQGENPHVFDLPASEASGYTHGYGIGANDGPSTPDPATLEAATGSKADGGQRMTPFTSRPSKAMKGRPVRICELCSPPRVRRLLCMRGTTCWI